MIRFARFSTVRRSTRALLVAAFAVSTLVMPATGASAKTLDLSGTIDCGLSSGERCTFGDKLILHTKDISGVAQGIDLDVSWIQKGDLEGLVQDEFLRFEVEEKPGGGYQALRLVRQDEDADGEGH